MWYYNFSSPSALHLQETLPTASLSPASPLKKPEDVFYTGYVLSMLSSILVSQLVTTEQKKKKKADT